MASNPHSGGTDNALVRRRLRCPRGHPTLFQLPEVFPESVVSTAKELTVGEDDPYFALLRWDSGVLYQRRVRGAALSLPYEPGMDSGNPFEVMDALLQTKRGYCVHGFDVCGDGSQCGHAFLGCAGLRVHRRGGQRNRSARTTVARLAGDFYRGSWMGSVRSSPPAVWVEESPLTPSPIRNLRPKPARRRRSPPRARQWSPWIPRPKKWPRILRWEMPMVVRTGVEYGRRVTRPLLHMEARWCVQSVARRAAMILAGDHPARMVWQEAGQRRRPRLLDNEWIAEPSSREAAYERLRQALRRRDSSPRVPS